jgi:hypothetical protein
MSKYVTDAMVMSDIVMPGSHDAGVSELHADAGILGWTGAAVCQSGSLHDQLIEGSRVFDLRARIVRPVNALSLENDPIVSGLAVDPGQVRFYHGGKKGGAKGDAVSDSLWGVRDFLDAHPSEFCILRFTKTQCPEPVLRMVAAILSFKLYQQPGNIAQHSVGANQIRGKAICVFDSSFNLWANHQQSGFHCYKKNDGCVNGLGIAGSYAGSPIGWQVNKSQKDKAIQYYVANNQGDRLYAWYQTVTYRMNIKSGTAGSVGSRRRMRRLACKLTDDENNVFKKINIVMMDFVDNEKCRKIYRANTNRNGGANLVVPLYEEELDPSATSWRAIGPQHQV